MTSTQKALIVDLFKAGNDMAFIVDVLHLPMTTIEQVIRAALKNIGGKT